jgi:hypothetical protein
VAIELKQISVQSHDLQEPVGAAFRFRTATQTRTTSPVWADEEGLVKWRNIHLPFESLSVRVRLFDEDLFSDDDPLGEVRDPRIRVRVRVMVRADDPFTQALIHVHSHEYLSQGVFHTCFKIQCS